MACQNKGRYRHDVLKGERFVGNTPNLVVSIVLYIIGIMLVLTAVLILLKGLGWLTTLPTYAIWSLLLLSVGVGILGGIRSSRGR